jgi:hypothetical protein
MKTTLAFIFTLLLAAISASALAMPCAQKAGALQEVQDARHQVRLHVASQQTLPDPTGALPALAASFKSAIPVSHLAI